MKVYGNDFHDNAFGGIAAQNEGSAMTNWYIYNNIIHDHTNYGIACLGGNGNNWWIWNNIFFHNAYSQDYKSYGAILAAPQNTKIAHNVFWNNPGGGIVHEGSASGVTVQNNIFYNNGEEGGVETGPAISYNWFNTSDPGARGSNAVTGSNPYFVNVSTPPYDFHINAANSNADGAGANLAGTSDYTIDLDARNDLRGSAPWLGVYEGEGQTTRPSAPQGLVIIIK